MGIDRPVINGHQGRKGECIVPKPIEQWSRGGSSLLRVCDDPMVLGRVRVVATTDFDKTTMVFKRDEIVEFARAVLAEYGPAK